MRTLWSSRSQQSKLRHRHSNSKKVYVREKNVSFTSFCFRFLFYSLSRVPLLSASTLLVPLHFVFFPVSLSSLPALLVSRAFPFLFSSPPPLLDSKALCPLASRQNCSHCRRSASLARPRTHSKHSRASHRQDAAERRAHLLLFHQYSNRKCKTTEKRRKKKKTNFLL